MILPDVNVLIGAFRVDADHHELLRRWLADVLDAGGAVALPAATLTGFLRIVTHQRIFVHPSALEPALDFVAQLLDTDNAVLAEAGGRHWTILRELSLAVDARGPLVPDAHLAALAIEHGATIATRDRGFARFPGLAWFDPLVDRR